MNVVDQLTESLTADWPSGNPLNTLPLRQFLVFVARTQQRSLTDLAELFGLSRETLHLDLRTATRTLSERRAPSLERPEPVPGRPYRYRAHEGDCPVACSYFYEHQGAGGNAALLSFDSDDLSKIQAEVFRCTATARGPSNTPAPPAGTPPPPPARPSR